MTTITHRICDVCKVEINVKDLYLNAETYGVDFHLACIEKISVRAFINLCGLDDMKVMRSDDWENARKASDFFTADGKLAVRDNYGK